MRSNSRQSRVRCLLFDGSGFWLATKRLKGATFDWPKDEAAVAQMSLARLRLLLEGFELRSRRGWRQYDERLRADARKVLCQKPRTRRHGRHCACWCQVVPQVDDPGVTHSASLRSWQTSQRAITLVVGDGFCVRQALEQSAQICVRLQPIGLCCFHYRP